MSNVKYCAVLQAQPEGGFTVTFPDILEAITEGDTREEALFHAADVLTLGNWGQIPNFRFQIFSNHPALVAKA